MTIDYHPQQDVLKAHAAGQLQPDLALLVESHLEQCENCRRLVRAGLAETSAGAVPAPHLAVSPSALERRLGRPISQLPWTGLAEGIEVVWLSEGVGRGLWLLRVAPGVKIPDHLHHGAETLVVLSGGMADFDRDFGPGEFLVYPDGSTHGPVALHDEPCVALVLTETGFSLL